MQYATFERILDEEEVADDLPDAPAPIDEAYVVDSFRLLSRATLLLTYDVFTAYGQRHRRPRRDGRCRQRRPGGRRASHRGARAMSGLHADALLQQITEPRRRALELLVRRGFAFDSNQTSDGITGPRIYWQVRAWLERRALSVTSVAIGACATFSRRPAMSFAATSRLSHEHRGQGSAACPDDRPCRVACEPVDAVESSQAQMSRLLVELTIRAQAATPFGPVPPDFRQPPTPIPAAAKKVSAAMPKHRFRSPAEIDEIVAFSIENSTAEACEVYNSAASSLSLWRRQRGAGRSRSKRIAPVRHSFDPQAAHDAAAESGSPTRSTKAVRGGSGHEGPLALGAANGQV